MIGRGKPTPGGRELRLLGQAVIKKNGELLGLERVQRRVLSLRPPANAALGKPARDQPETKAVIAEKFERRAAPIAKDEEGAGEGVFRQFFLAERCQAINAIAEVNWLAGEQDPKLRDKLDHWLPSRRKSAKSCLVETRSSAGIVKVRREPSGRSI